MFGWVRAASRRPLERRYTERLSRYLDETQPYYYLLPLQLESDYQIRSHSPFKSMVDVMEVVLNPSHRRRPSIRSSSSSCIRSTTGRRTSAAARSASRAGRSRRPCQGDGRRTSSDASVPERGRCRGQQHDGLSALTHSRPVEVLGNAIFNVPGMTFQGWLGEFWHESATRRTARGVPQGCPCARAGEWQLLHRRGARPRRRWRPEEVQLVPPAAGAAVPPRRDSPRRASPRQNPPFASALRAWAGGVRAGDGWRRCETPLARHVAMSSVVNPTLTERMRP